MNVSPSVLVNPRDRTGPFEDFFRQLKTFLCQRYRATGGVLQKPVPNIYDVSQLNLQLYIHCTLNSKPSIDPPLQCPTCTVRPELTTDRDDCRKSIFLICDLSHLAFGLFLFANLESYFPDIPT